ncbi:MAG TPA: proline dehydrogenase family protein [Gemmatimonadales bacterium]|nr:proline dehydrogenase family protein [Gemmatimonadales bacterium]
MMRQGLLWLSEQKQIFNFVRRNGVARQFASRFVAGESTDDAVGAAETLQKKGISATLDLLGESVTKAEEAEAAAEQYVQMVDELARRGVEVNVSVKLTQMGFDLDEALCRRNVLRIVERAAAHRGFVRLDMESSAYTDRTLAFYLSHVHPNHGAHCGVVLQSSLRRTDEDVQRMIDARVRVRLCKGAYLEPPSVAYPEKSDVDKAFVRQMERLLEHGNYPGIATHDEAIIAHARKFVQRAGIAPERYEFQMLFGVRRDLQEQLRQAGHNMRVYIPFGTQWYPYLMRRLAERPANIAFILGNIVKESVPGL